MASLYIDGAWAAGASGATSRVASASGGTVARAVDVAAGTGRFGGEA